MTGELATAIAGLDAIGFRDERTLLRLSHSTITIFGPLGASRGLENLRRWYADTRFRAVPTAAYRAGGRILVLHKSIWLSAEGRETGSRMSGSVFTVDRGYVLTYLRDDGPDVVLRQGFHGAQPLPLLGAVR